MTASHITDRPFLTTAEAAKILGVAQDKITDFINDGSLLAVNIARHPGGIRPRWRVPRESLLAFLTSRQSQPAPAPVTRPRKQTTGANYY